MDIERDDIPMLAYETALENLKSQSAHDFEDRIKEFRFDFDSLDKDGKTLLIHLAETVTNTDHMWVLLEYFADPNIKDNSGNTALHYACKNNQKGMILALLIFGANTEIVNLSGKAPFDLINMKQEDIEPIIEKIKKYKFNFIQLTRERRQKLKKIYDEIDNDQIKTINEYKLRL